MALAESHSKKLLIVTLLLLIWTTLFVTCRCWAKWSQKKWSWTDAEAFGAAYALGVAQCSTIFVATTQYGFGYDNVAKPAHETSLLRALYASELLYVASVGFTRCSAALFVSSLSLDKLRRMAGNVLIGISATWTVSSLIAIAVRGDSSAPWETTEPLFTRWLAVEIVAIMVELSFWIFSFTLVWSLNMPVLRRLKLISIFTTRLILIPFILLSVLRLRPATYHNTNHDVTMFNIYTQVVMHFALIAECLTCLKPIMQTFHEEFAAGSGAHYWSDLAQPHSTDGGGTNSSKAGVVVWQKEAPAWKRSNSRHRRDEDIELRTDVCGGFSTKIEGKRKDGSGRSEDDVELLSGSNIRVEKSMTMSVS